jgi:hypothetical protein
MNGAARYAEHLTLAPSISCPPTVHTITLSREWAAELGFRKFAKLKELLAIVWTVGCENRPSHDLNLGVRAKPCAGRVSAGHQRTDVAVPSGVSGGSVTIFSILLLLQLVGSPSKERS